MTPAAQLSFRTANERHGVGINCGYIYTLIPFAANTPAATLENRSEFMRES